VPDNITAEKDTSLEDQICCSTYILADFDIPWKAPGSKVTALAIIVRLLWLVERSEAEMIRIGTQTHRHRYTDKKFAGTQAESVPKAQRQTWTLSK
jgi:hypothetical protein